MLLRRAFLQCLLKPYAYNHSISPLALKCANDMLCTRLLTLSPLAKVWVVISLVAMTRDSTSTHAQTRTHTLLAHKVLALVICDLFPSIAAISLVLIFFSSLSLPLSVSPNVSPFLCLFCPLSGFTPIFLCGHLFSSFFKCCYNVCKCTISLLLEYRKGTYLCLSVRLSVCHKRERKCVIDNAYLSVFGIVPFRFSFGSLPLWNSGTAKGLKCAHSATFTCRQACTDTYIVISHYHSGNLWASIPMHLHVCVHARGLHILSVQLVTDRWFCSVSVLHDFSLQRTLSGLVLFLSHHASQPVVISL